MGLDSEAPRWRSLENELLRSCSYQDEEDGGEERRGGLSPADLQISAWATEAGSGAKLAHSGSEGWMKWQEAAERVQPFSPFLYSRLPWLSKN
jgi:hypothetical protein